MDYIEELKERKNKLTILQNKLLFEENKLVLDKNNCITKLENLDTELWNTEYDLNKVTLSLIASIVTTGIGIVINLDNNSKIIIPIIGLISSLYFAKEMIYLLKKEFNSEKISDILVLEEASDSQLINNSKDIYNLINDVVENINEKISLLQSVEDDYIKSREIFNEIMIEIENLETELKYLETLDVYNETNRLAYLKRKREN